MNVHERLTGGVWELFSPRDRILLGRFFWPTREAIGTNYSRTLGDKLRFITNLGQSWEDREPALVLMTKSSEIEIAVRWLDTNDITVMRPDAKRSKSGRDLARNFIKLLEQENFMGCPDPILGIDRLESIRSREFEHHGPEVFEFRKIPPSKEPTCRVCRDYLSCVAEGRPVRT